MLSTSEEQRHHLQSMLEQSGLTVVLSAEAGDNTLSQLSANAPDVLLIDIGDSDEEWDYIDTISEQSNIPILFNDSGVEGVSLASSGEVWAKKLAQKLMILASKKVEEPVVARGRYEAPYPRSSNQAIETSGVKADSVNSNATQSTATGKLAGARKPAGISSWGQSAKANQDQSASADTGAVKPLPVDLNMNVWVLGASLGGPQAVRQFLSTISEDLPVAFILAQHIGANHINLLAEQLNRVTAFTVLPGKSGHRLKQGEVVLTPADKEIGFTDDGCLTLKPASPSAIYSPSIDNVMKEVARRFGKNAGTIVFSGMGDDGADGCQAIAECGGIVWAQDIASCVVSSMPDRARMTGKVSYSANPEQLAEHLYGYYCSSGCSSGQ